ncbi:MAG: valine--tRNA ligase [Phycisphaeraceae bacterium]|nr:valine--tRNA ligase [Phycisphaeraceae bacterium]
MTTEELAKQYRPADVEPAILERWTKSRAFHADPMAPSRPYSIVIPPPNVTAALHMGHALNNTLQDILIRHRRMAGDNAVWIPGTDHAGIATQTVVEKRVLREENKKRTDFSREEFVKKIQAWKDEYEATITNQLKLMGCSCDWDRQAFTMDAPRARAVREAFFRLFKDGLIYRGKRLVNWDPVTQTALADDEVEMEEIDGHFYYLRYPLEGPPLANGQNYVTVATTRPETMLGDTAVAINPKDPRAAELRGRLVLLPIVNRVIPIIEDDYVVLPDPEGDDPKAKFATGFLKVTPAHDPNDYEIGQRHKLPVINVLAPDASISKNHGWPANDWTTDRTGGYENDAAFLLGMDRFEARRTIVRWFKDHQMLEDMKPYKHAVGHSYRSHVPIEPYLSDQWYVKVTDDRLAGAALRSMASDQRDDSSGRLRGIEEAADHPGRGSSEAGLRFYPERYAKTFQSWHENIRDWCISRQLWWGHRIPVWSYPHEKYQSSTLGTNLKKWGHSDRVSINYRNRTLPDALGKPGDDNVIGHFVCVRDADDQEVINALEQEGFTQDPDVLDTWFSSALWPFSTLGWPESTRELNIWNPGAVLCTAREIITLWVSRMVMTNLYFLNRLPFKDVFIHAMIQDGEGQKMSKTLGNGVDPLDIIHSHGADAMRFTLAAMTTQTQDVRMPVSAICPHCGKVFTPTMTAVSGGYRVMSPASDCPQCKKTMVTSYGVNAGEKTTAEKPAARNTSEKFDYGRNFANKLWNATRFALGILGDAKPDNAGSSAANPATSSTRSELSLPDKWILSRLATTVRATNEALANYEFSAYAQGLYDFIWRDLCDWYIEAIKPTAGENAVQRRVLALCLDASLRLLHPAMPFITEKLWEKLNEVAPLREISGVTLTPGDLLATAAWPLVAPELIDESTEAEFALTQEVISTLRQVRTTYKVPPKQKVLISAKAPAAIASRLLSQKALIETLANVTCGEIGPRVEKPADAAAALIAGTEHYLHGLVQADAEKARLTKRLEEVTRSIAALEGRLANKSYADRAPASLVQQTRDQLAAAQKEAETLRAQVAAL